MTKQIGPIVIFFSSKSPDYDPFTEPVYKNSYYKFAASALMKGIDLRFIFGADSYTDGVFSSYWKLENDNIIKINEPFHANLIYLKSRTDIFDNEKRVNNTFLEEICRDKLKTAATFPEYTKKTIRFNQDNLAMLNSLTTDPIIIKPQLGSSGDSVTVIKKKDIATVLPQKKGFIAQEIIESQSGIPGLLEQRHELRLFMFDGEILATYIRLPAKDSYLANISQGAVEKQITLSQIPYSALTIAKKIDEKFNGISPRLYTIDLMYENGRPWLVELNDMPGTPDINVQPFTDNYFETLLNFLSSAANK